MTGETAASAAFLKERLGPVAFDLAIILGSGLGALVEHIAEPIVLNYRDIDGFPVRQIPGHAGRLFAGRWQNWRVLVFQGRYHLYQGFNAYQAAFPVRVAGQLGCRRLLLTNAAGGINPAYRPGDFMFIDDHLNLLGDNPLRGIAEAPFIDLSHLYQQSLCDPLQSFARQRRIPLHRGVLAALMGPSYETPAEIRMLQRLGADAVSMSTVPEAIMGKYLGMETVGLSLIANLAAGLAEQVLNHDEVIQVGTRATETFGEIVRHLFRVWQEVN